MKTLEHSSQAIDEVVKNFTADPVHGLSHSSVERLRQEYGTNEIKSKTVKWWHILVKQLVSPFIYLLIGAAVLALILGEIIDGTMIFIFLLINTFLGFYQEYNSEKTLQLLQQYVASFATVIRGGKEENINVKDLVPGDLVELGTGSKIPADVRLVDCYDLTVDESALTGESVSIKKGCEVLPNIPKAVHEASNICFAGTTVVSGKARGIVVATGDSSAIGNIAKLAIESSKKSSVFEKGIDRFSNFILKLIVITIIFIFLANWFIKGDKANLAELVIFSIALAVSVIPEALPVVTTFSLSRGALLLAKKKVVVRRLSAIEALGGIEVLCTDKTGTLTENSLTVVDFYGADKNKAILYGNLASTSPQKHKLEPFDIALWEALPAEQKELVNKYQRKFDIPFDPKRRRNSVVLEHEHKNLLILRGAPENIFSLCKNVNSVEKNKINAWIAEHGKEGDRVLAIACKEITDPAKLIAEEKFDLLEQDLELMGIIAFVDPIKPTTKTTVKQAKELGVKIKIITGDSKEVAGAVAHQIGLIGSPSEVISGEELEELSAREQHQAVEKYSVFARISPEQKYNIIQLLQEKSSVGFLGEGINDAPALKLAEVSLVVQSASDIARESADIVLLKKNLQVIIEGIKEGRKIFANTTKYIKATLSSNFGNFYAVAISSLFIDFLPMLPLQILLLNLLSDFPMIAIAADSVDPDETRKPTAYNIKDVIYIATVLGVVSTVFDFMFFGLFYRISPEVLQTNWFIGSILTELVFLFSIRTRKVFYKASRPSNIVFWLSGLAIIATVAFPYTSVGRSVFHFTPPSNYHLLIIFSLVAVYFVVSETVKNMYYKKVLGIGNGGEVKA